MSDNEASSAERRVAELASCLRGDAQKPEDLTAHPLAQELAEGLCRYLPEVMGHKYRRWSLESLDHVALTLLRFVNERELEAAGLCILIWDPTTMPFHIRLELADDASGVPKAVCKAGEVDPSTGQIVRLAWGSEPTIRYSDLLNQRLDSIRWSYEVELTDAHDA